MAVVEALLALIAACVGFALLARRLAAPGLVAPIPELNGEKPRPRRLLGTEGHA